ncbi:hypothetical protein M427DRAFT_288277 [Gonapodya prolifera JEL478]|uniref:F-box domain-containing protein n=1 Tax=Gonapodya prolifera (strain JEL478) TaxID=1344416 RepID=A0A139AIN5_GONPJ|nr:hypothetical protein M427DRAFT_288277 [Gonapodya prolifera JEL478]|eukprot:KXS16608.1 hypothetical protein M427DRAFT_288277 [Gonapodya prolifera JEL478]
MEAATRTIPSQDGIHLRKLPKNPVPTLPLEIIIAILLLPNKSVKRLLLASCLCKSLHEILQNSVVSTKPTIKFRDITKLVCDARIDVVLAHHLLQKNDASFVNTLVAEERCLVCAGEVEDISFGLLHRNCLMRISDHGGSLERRYAISTQDLVAMDLRVSLLRERLYTFGAMDEARKRYGTPQSIQIACHRMFFFKAAHGAGLIPTANTELLDRPISLLVAGVASGKNLVTWYLRDLRNARYERARTLYNGRHQFQDWQPKAPHKEGRACRNEWRSWPPYMQAHVKTATPSFEECVHLWLSGYFLERGEQSRDLQVLCCDRHSPCNQHHAQHIFDQFAFHLHPISKVP